MQAARSVREVAYILHVPRSPAHLLARGCEYRQCLLLVTVRLVQFVYR